MFALVMDRLINEVRQESLWGIIFTDDIKICSESRKQVEESQERWRYTVERKGQLPGNKTE